MGDLPLWAWLLGNVGTALVTAAVAAAAVVFTSRNATRQTEVEEQAGDDLERRSRREQRWDILKWAAELAASDNPGQASMGVSQLRQLAASPEFDHEQRAFVKTALRAVTEAPAEAYRELEHKPTVVSPGATLIGGEDPSAGSTGGG